MKPPPLVLINLSHVATLFDSWWNLGVCFNSYFVLDKVRKCHTNKKSLFLCDQFRTCSRGNSR